MYCRDGHTYKTVFSTIYTLTRKERCFFAFSLLFEKMCYSATSLKLGKVINHLKYTCKDTIQIQIAKIKNKNIFFVFPSHRQVVTHYQYSIFGLNKNASIYVYNSKCVIFVITVLLVGRNTITFNKRKKLNFNFTNHREADEQLCDIISNLYKSLQIIYALEAKKHCYSVQCP